MPITAKGRTIIEQRSAGRLKPYGLTPWEREAFRMMEDCPEDHPAVIHPDCLKDLHCPFAGQCAGEECYMLECER